jgi:hypothetical protein
MCGMTISVDAFNTALIKQQQLLLLLQVIVQPLSECALCA